MDESYIFQYGPLTNKKDKVMFVQRGLNRGREKMAGEGFIHHLKIVFQARPRGGPRPRWRAAREFMFFIWQYYWQYMGGLLINLSS